jgi:hypothetical protein
MKINLNIPLIVAFCLAAIGGAISLLGLVSMFSLAFAPIGLGLECGKLSAAAALHSRWTQLGWFVRTVLTTIVICLVILTSSGLYGFTLEHYLAHVAELTAPVQERIAAADEDIRGQVEKVADTDRQIAQIDAAPALEIPSTARPKTAAQIAAQAKAQAEANKLRIAEDQRRQAKRDGLAVRREQEAGELARLRTVRAEIASQQQAAESEIGALKLIADALHVDAAKVVAVSVASLYDLLAITLLIAASTHKPTVPATVEPGKAAPRKASTKRSNAARKGWQNRRRKVLVAASGKPVMRVK